VFEAELIKAEEAWQPFRVDYKADYVRPLAGPGGVEDRLRTVAFAELQARECFRWGAKKFAAEKPDWAEQWLHFAEVENRHAQMLLDRFSELGLSIGARTVSNKLTRLCKSSSDPVMFLFLLASAEERGMEAGSIIGTQMAAIDAKSAAIFKQIADEEVEHVAFSKKALEEFDFVALRERAKEIDRRIGAGI